jgi:protein-S-isoprenylcysteine O-methyltransferase Ste14
MTIKKSLEVSGNFLFKYRGHIPLIVFILVVPISFLTPYKTYASYHGLNETILFTALFLIFSGHLIRARTVGKRTIQTSGRNRSHQVAQVLNKIGWYSLVRHPLYFGNYLIWLGLAIFLSNFWFVIILSLLFWIYYERIMFAEEVFLEEKFGGEFTDWASKTPSFFPSFKNYVPNLCPFSWRIVAKNEYPGIISSATSFLLILILKRSVLLGHLSFCSSDAVFAVIIVVFGVSCKILKKYTSVFEPMD